MVLGLPAGRKSLGSATELHPQVENVLDRGHGLLMQVDWPLLATHPKCGWTLNVDFY